MTNSFLFTFETSYLRLVVKCYHIAFLASVIVNDVLNGSVTCHKLRRFDNVDVVETGERSFVFGQGSWLE